MDGKGTFGSGAEFGGGRGEAQEVIAPVLNAFLDLAKPVACHGAVRQHFLEPDSQAEIGRFVYASPFVQHVRCLLK